MKCILYVKSKVISNMGLDIYIMIQNIEILKTERENNLQITLLTMML